MKILFIGDIAGKAGRDALDNYIPTLREEYKPDILIIDGDNAANGYGITEKICKEFYALGADCITTGNHVWDQREILSYITRDPSLLRAANYPETAPGQGACIKTLPTGQKILIIHLMGRIYMPDPLDCPFQTVDKILKNYQLGANVNAIFVDFHAETGSEKMCMAHYLDGRVSAVVGTHTHIPTADCQILPNGTGYQTDAGMTGCYDSSIGMDKEIPIHRFTRKTPGKQRMFPAKGEGTLCGTLIETDNDTGKVRKIDPIIIGKHLKNTKPIIS
ncbi:MAG: TIGR00282 family metallophosphoesterase [Alphaproteobacteria bacterium]|nr:TIGR00282 family metallophosphoesterase [Alphaproteobacteria bacterium]